MARIFIALSATLAAAACSSESGGIDGEPCAPGPAAVWLEEGEPLELALECEPSAITGLPVGAAFNPDTGVLAWTPGLDQAAVYVVDVEHAAGLTPLTIGVADDWDHPDNIPVLDPTNYPAEFGIPVMFVSPAPQSADVSEPITIVYGGRTYRADGKQRGAASLGYPKKSYTLTFDNDTRLSDRDRDFIAKRKVVLTSTFDDNAYIRQRLAYDLWNDLDADHLEVQTFHVALFVDGEYFGLYLLGDHVDRHFMEDRGLSDDGNVYKAVNHEANFRETRRSGDPKATLHEGYEKKEGPDGDFSDLHELVQFADSSTDQEFVADIDNWIDRRDYEDWFVFVTFAMSDDSAGKNSYHYHDPAGGPWRFVTWDHNAAIGQNWQTRRQAGGEPRDYFYTNRLFERFFEIDSIGNAIESRYAQTLQNAYHIDVVLDRVDSYIAEIDRSARRDWARWREAYRTYNRWSDRSDFTEYDGEVDYVRQWLTDRWNFQSGEYPPGS